MLIEYVSGIRAPPRDYGIPGSNINKVFTTIGASASLVFAFNTGMLPEIQVKTTKTLLLASKWAIFYSFSTN